MDKTEEKSEKGDPDSCANQMTEKPTKVAENAESSEEDINLKDIEAGKNVSDDMKPTKVVENAESLEEDINVKDIEEIILEAGKNVSDDIKATKVAENAESLEEDINFKDIEEIIMEAGKNVSETAQDMKDVATADVDEYGVPPISPEELAKMILPAENSARVTDMNINPLTLELMSMCLAKNILYAPIKHVVSKYPEWLEENKPTLSATEYNKRVEQFELLKSMCSEYEKEENNDSEDVKTERLKILMDLMYKVRCCGEPPIQF